jgi:hypothetical protein
MNSPARDGRNPHAGPVLCCCSFGRLAEEKGVFDILAALRRIGWNFGRVAAKV